MKKIIFSIEITCCRPNITSDDVCTVVNNIRDFFKKLPTYKRRPPAVNTDIHLRIYMRVILFFG